MLTAATMEVTVALNLASMDLNILVELMATCVSTRRTPIQTASRLTLNGLETVISFFILKTTSFLLLFTSIKCELLIDWCDYDEYNTIDCGYDGGDCCQESCLQDTSSTICGVNGYDCLVCYILDNSIRTFLMYL